MPETTGTKSVLIVEDEQEVRSLLAMVFEMEGFTVFQANDAEQALELFQTRSGDIDAIITDLGLPGLGGIEMIGMMRAMSPTVKIIGASGYGRENVGRKVLDAGGDLFVPKPFVAMELVQAVRDLMDNK